MLPETGERTQEWADELNNSTKAQSSLAIAIASLVILYPSLSKDRYQVLRNPPLMIASDGQGRRCRAGTCSRVLVRYVREQGRLTLTDACGK